MKAIQFFIFIIFLFNSCSISSDSIVLLEGDYNDKYKIQPIYESGKISRLLLSCASSESYLYLQKKSGEYLGHLSMNTKIDFLNKDDIEKLIFINEHNQEIKLIELNRKIVNDDENDGIEIIELFYNFEVETNIKIGSLIYKTNQNKFQFRFMFQAFDRTGNYFEFIGNNKTPYLKMKKINNQHIELYVWSTNSDPIFSITNIPELKDSDFNFELP